MRSKEEDRRLRNIAQNKKRAANRELYNEEARQWRQKNKDKINAKKRTAELRKKLNEGVKNWRERNKEKYVSNRSEYRKKNRIEVNARNLIYKHISRGKMVRGNMCNNCGGEGKMQAHHDDYSKPLEVKWLCKVCHRHKHNKLLDVIP